MQMLIVSRAAEVVADLRDFMVSLLPTGMIRSRYFTHQAWLGGAISVKAHESSSKAATARARTATNFKLGHDL
jgi:hypothetical protein